MKLSAIILLIILISLRAKGQGISPSNLSGTFRVNKISGGINFDGIPDEAVWQTIEPMPLVMLEPTAGGKPTELTVVRIAYDDDYFYVSGWLYNKNPKDVRAIGKKRDLATMSTDWFGFVMDTFNDKENGVSFHTNPNGVRTDGTVRNDGVSVDDDISFNWNTFWDVKTAVTAQGWSAEFRIPFSSLRFQSANGKTNMGLLLMRYSAAKSEVDTWPVVSPDFRAPYWKPSLFKQVEFEGLQSRKPLYIAPYLTAGLGQVNKLNGQRRAYQMHTTFKKDAGLDVKYGLTNNLTADITVNTDFAQVEADDQKINLTRFSLYFPEKRIFFLEKADVFDFSFLGGNNLFYSRRIGLHEGNPVRIYGGLRVTGKAGKWDLGFLDMQTASFGANPGENFGVIRTKREILNENSYVGGMVTSRLGMNGAYNLAYGLDGQFRVTGDEYLTLKLAQTFERDSLNTIFDIAPSRFLAQWQHRRETGFGYDFVYTWSGKRFNPGVGFEVKQNYQGSRIIVWHGWLPDSKTFIRFHKISLTGYNFYNTLTGRHETSTALLQWDFSAKKGFAGNIAANWYLENLQDKLTLGNNQAKVPDGRYSFAYLSAKYSTSANSDLSAEFQVESGKFFDGWKNSVMFIPNLKIGTSFDFGLIWSLDHLNFSKRAESFTNHIIRLKGLMTLTTKTSLSAFVQYNTAIDGIIANVRFRYNPREGNDFYIVYDEGLNTYRTREIPSLPFSSGRTILLKYTYTFRL